MRDAPAVVVSSRGMSRRRRPRTYRLNGVQRSANAVYTLLTRLGLGARYRHLLTVTGRRSGVARTNPVDVMTHDGSRWLVAPYGEVEWVRNLRVAGVGSLRRGRRPVPFRAREADASTAVPVIRLYIESVPVTRAYWGVGTDATDEELMDESARHPVFRLTPVEAT